MFAEGGPECFFHKQASWIYTFWPGYDADTDPPTVEFEPGVDSSFFYVPPIDDAYGRPALGAGDMFMMFNDRDEVRAVIEFLAQRPRPPSSGLRPAASCRRTARSRRTGTACTRPLDWPRSWPAGIYKFDASDLMPAEVGQRVLGRRHGWRVAANTEEVFRPSKTAGRLTDR